MSEGAFSHVAAQMNYNVSNTVLACVLSCTVLLQIYLLTIIIF